MLQIYTITFIRFPFIIPMGPCRTESIYVQNALPHGIKEGWALARPMLIARIPCNRCSYVNAAGTDTKHKRFMGGHAVIAVGYDASKKAVLVRNSGAYLGVKGHFWMPYKLITNPKLAHDFWTIRGVVC